MRNIVAICLTMLVCTFSYAQQPDVCAISALVLDNDTGQPLDYASVVVADDKSGVKKFLNTDTLGRFSHEVERGNYFLEISYTGYTKQQHVMEITADTLLNVRLNPAPERLAAAVVEASRIEHGMEGYRLDNLSKNRQLATIPLPDILQTAPGIWSIPGEGITIFGKTATVYIDNREITIPANTVTDYLGTFSGKDIKSVEIITNPGGEYRSGNPVIRITSNMEEGGKLIAQGGYIGLSEYRDILRQSDVLTYKRGRTVINADFIYNYMRFKNSTQEKVFDNAGMETGNEKSISRARVPHSINANAGVTHNFTKNSFLSVNMAGRFFKRNGNETNRDLTDTHPSANTDASSHASDDMFRVSALFSNIFENRAKLEMKTNYMYSSKINSFENALLQDKSYTYSTGKIKTHTFNIQGNYSTRLLKKNDKFTFGAYYNYLANSNDSRLASRTQTDKNVTERKFEYNESLLCGFFDWSYSLKAIAFRIGGRAEYSDIDGSSYFNFTPDILATIFANRNRGHIIRLSYTMHKQRPSVGDLDPTPYYTNDGYVTIGNPDLKVATLHQATMNLTFMNRYTLSAGYGHTADMAMPYYYEQDGILYQSIVSGGKSTALNIMLQTIIMPVKKWNINISAGYEYQNMILADYTNQVNALAIDFSIMCMIKLGFNINGILKYRSDAISGLNIQENSPVQASITLNKNLFKNKLRISMGCMDIFNTNKTKKRDVILENGMTRKIRSNINSRSLTITLNYNFDWGDRVMTKPADFGNSDMERRINRD